MRALTQSTHPNLPAGRAARPACGVPSPALVAHADRGYACFRARTPSTTVDSTVGEHLLGLHRTERKLLQRLRG